MATAYTAIDELLVKVGSVECYVTRDSTLIGVPSLSAHDTPRYLKVSNEGHGTLTVTVERRLPS